MRSRAFFPSVVVFRTLFSVHVCGLEKSEKVVVQREVRPGEEGLPHFLLKHTSPSGGSMPCAEETSTLFFLEYVAHTHSLSLRE